MEINGCPRGPQKMGRLRRQRIQQVAAASSAPCSMRISLAAFLQLAFLTLAVGSTCEVGTDDPLCHTRVIIVGAGMSGLAAARTLIDNWETDESSLKGGLHVTILEASDRVGGRVWTANDEQTQDAGAEADLGAFWIHDSSTHNPVTQIASVLGATLAFSDDEQTDYFECGAAADSGFTCTADPLDPRAATGACEPVLGCKAVNGTAVRESLLAFKELYQQAKGRALKEHQNRAELFASDDPDDTSTIDLADFTEWWKQQLTGYVHPAASPLAAVEAKAEEVFTKIFSYIKCAELPFDCERYAQEVEETDTLTARDFKIGDNDFSLAAAATSTVYVDPRGFVTNEQIDTDNELSEI